MGKYLSFQKTATRMITRKGGTVTLTRDVPGTYDPIQDQEVGGGPQSYVFKAVALPPTQQNRFGIGSLEGRDVLEFYFALEGQAIQPKAGDRVTTAPEQIYTLFYAQTFDPALDGAIMTIAYGER